MAITHTIRLDMQQPGTRQLIYAKQGDTERKLEISLYNGGTAFDVQATGYTRLICFCKPDGTGGVYDKMPDNSDATTVTDNLVTAKLHPQMFTCAGSVLCELRMTTSAGVQLGTWSWIIQVEPTVTSGITSEDYYKFASIDSLRAALVKLRSDFDGRTKLLVCSGLRATFGGQTIEGAEMPTVDGDVYEAVQLEVLGDDAPADGDIILGENGYFAVYGHGLTDGAATLTGTGTRLDWPSGGSGGVLRVTVARAANGTFTADKTFAEIKAAYDAGSAVEAAYTDNKSQNRCILPLVYCTTDGCSFSAYLQTETEERELIQLSCSKTGGWGDSSGGIPAGDVAYQGEIGSEQVQGTIDDAIAALAIGEPLDKSADYAGSGAASVQAWATAAATGDATKYRVAPGRYQVYHGGAEYIDYITIIDSPGNTTRFVYITSCDISGPFVYLDVYSATSPGAAPVSQVYFSSEERFFSVYGKNVILPDYSSADNDKVLTIKNGYPSWVTVPALPAVSAADNGKFLRVVSGAWAAQALTNVAEVGA
nr:MAG TPA: tail protein [Caudoviricetes sp.]